MSIDLDDPRLTAYALGELDDAAEIAALETWLRDHPEARQVVEEIRATGDLLRRELTAEHESTPALRDLTIQRAVEQALQPRHRHRRLSWGLLSIAASTLILGGTTFLMMSKLPFGEAKRGPAPVAATAEAPAPAKAENFGRAAAPASVAEVAGLPADRRFDGATVASRERTRAEAKPAEPFYARRSNGVRGGEQGQAQPAEPALAPAADESVVALRSGSLARSDDFESRGVALAESARAPMAAPPAPGGGNALPAEVQPATAPAVVSADSLALATAPVATPAPTASAAPRYVAPAPPGMMGGALAAAPAAAPAALVPAAPEAAPVVAPAAPVPASPPTTAGYAALPRIESKSFNSMMGLADAAKPADRLFDMQQQTEPEAKRQAPNQRKAKVEREAFAPITENPFVRVLEQPQSTFALDVDTASYAIVRRYLLSQNAMPSKDAVRIEEMVNAFHYDDPAPTGDDPVAVHVEIARSPWSAENRLARIALAGRVIAPKDRPRANLVFLIDVSGSMDEPDKLPLLKRGMRMLTEQLGEGDRVSIVTYSNTARVALPPTRGDQQREILSALEAVSPGGSTNGEGGLNLAYEQAGAAFIEDGANRVILASDGDFNVGETDNNALVNLIQEKAKSRIFLTVLGFGRGNLQDARLEALADKGNGHYHYIDSPREARRVLVQQVSGTLVTVAKDVKIQVDFNPTKVGAYRLIGFENRILPAEAFRDDKKDGGELGAGHAVCALYELIPAGKEGKLPAADAPQFVKPSAPADPKAPESFVVKLAFKPPDGDVSTFRSIPAVDSGKDYAEASGSFRWASAVASFGQILRGSAFRGTATIDGVRELAESARGDDPRGERKEFLEMVRKAKELGAR